ncbi:MAG: hypothetical protein UW63_C0089G0005 [Candidatus Uhrbacteria bacterium GW2011_GWF2_44_350]|uniref:Uncharacterized protein n=1 Tax=Candidatus Uhrbacteria bacterium GW2011_GWF2_44_350 TaxID=1619000 RepID=A0A0G1M801_9BACT|nr:MAG: hypothetical protein UW63_C0089G0005 [Candidatus Uhrbacteria bacterium GW2011_GWF2_44_350]
MNDAVVHGRTRQEVLEFGEGPHVSREVDRDAEVLVEDQLLWFVVVHLEYDFANDPVVAVQMHADSATV